MFPVASDLKDEFVLWTPLSLLMAAYKLPPALCSREKDDYFMWSV